VTYSKILAGPILTTSASPNGWTSAPNDALEPIIGGSDATFAHDASNNSGTTTQDQGYTLATGIEGSWNDLIAMQSLTIQLRYGWATTFSNRTWNSLSARVMSGSTVLAASTSGGGFETIASSITNTTPTNSSTVSFSYINTSAGLSEWSSAVVELRIDTTRSAGGSTVERRVYSATITGNYYAYRPELKYYNGSVWQWKPLFYYNDITETWRYGTLKRWDGTQWVREPDGVTS
jgi:hypothetical protein